MPQESVDASHFSPDIQEFLYLLHKYQVRYVIVGGEAVIYYGHIRLTGDIDVFYDHQNDNAHALFLALNEFWQGAIPGLSTSDELTQLGTVVQFGVQPNRLDLINQIEAVTFSQAWANKHTVTLTLPDGKIPLHYLGRTELIRNKASVARPKDLDDLNYLQEQS